jgi:uncharacterized protein YqjF (DUF2071 family)
MSLGVHRPGVAPLALRYQGVCLLSWPVDAAALPALPAGVALATREGDAWLTVVAMTVRVRSLPDRVALGYWNVRTPVTVDGERGAYLLDLLLDGRAPAAVAKRLLPVPARSGSVTVAREGDGISVEARRRLSRFAATFTPAGSAAEPAPDSLDDWLVDRPLLVGTDGRSERVDHDPWRLRPAACSVTAEGLLADHPGPTGERRARVSPGTVARL